MKAFSVRFSSHPSKNRVVGTRHFNKTGPELLIVLAIQGTLATQHWNTHVIFDYEYVTNNKGRVDGSSSMGCNHDLGIWKKSFF